MTKYRPALQNQLSENTLGQVPIRFLVTLAIETWRIRRKLSRLKELSSSDETAGLSVSIERLDSCLQEVGIECKDYDNQPYDDGLCVKVLDYEERAEMDPEVELIVQTVAPGIILRGTLIRLAEVVVARGISGRGNENNAEHS